MHRMSVLAVLAAALILSLSSCGGRSSPTTPLPPGSPAPAPTPTPVASSSPTPSPPCDGCEPPVTNRNPVARVILKLYQCFDRNNQPAFCPDPVKQVVQEPVPVGYRIRLDVTGRDADQHDTNGVSNGEGIVFIYSDPSFVDEHLMSNWQRKLTVLKPGKWEVYAVFDGVPSNSLGFTFIP